MSNENYKEIINNEVFDSLHKVIRLMRSKYPITRNEDNTVQTNMDFIHESRLFNNTVQQFIALQINAYNKFNNLDFISCVPVAPIEHISYLIEPETPVFEPTINEPTTTPVKPKKKRNRKKKANVTNADNSPMFERVAVIPDVGIENENDVELDDKAIMELAIAQTLQSDELHDLITDNSTDVFRDRKDEVPKEN